jgi:Tfp pilus assembly protein PilF
MDEILGESGLAAGHEGVIHNGPTAESPTRAARAKRPGRAPSKGVSKSARRWLVVLAILAIAGVPGYLLVSRIYLKTPSERAAKAVMLGLVEHRAGKMDSAKAKYSAALRIDPQNKLAHYNLGLIAQTQSDHATAEREYRITLAIDPNFPPALFNLAIIRTDAGSIGEAEDLYRRTITLEPKNAAAHLNLGFVLVRVGQKVAAEKEFTEAVRLDPMLAGRIPQENRPS